MRRIVVGFAYVVRSTPVVVSKICKMRFPFYGEKILPPPEPREYEFGIFR